jgi:hypothetical protein
MARKKVLKYTLISVLLIFAGWAIIPIFIDREVSEELPNQATTITVQETPTSVPSPDAINEKQEMSIERSGTFSGRNNYSAEGSVRLVEDADGVRYLRFDDNFKTSNGPDLLVYIGSEQDRGISLGVLKGNIGSQNYQLPDDLDVQSVDTVTIFCRSFNVDFGSASL